MGPAGDIPLTIGTAGHVDHGKTALIKALTGIDTDRLAEERERGLSIELGYAELALPDGRPLSVVDVPGHERFIRAMVAGATGVDMFILVVDADEGVMPQTREHLDVLAALEVRNGIVALTKCDRAGDEARELARDEVAGLLPSAPLVEVSALTGEGLDDLRTELVTLANQVEGERQSRADRSDEPAVLHVDRSFSLRGIGTVVTGTLWSGAVAAGTAVEILPSGIGARVRSVQVHNRDAKAGRAGQRRRIGSVPRPRALRRRNRASRWTTARSSCWPCSRPTVRSREPRVRSRSESASRRGMRSRRSTAWWITVWPSGSRRTPTTS